MKSIDDYLEELKTYIIRLDGDEDLVEEYSLHLKAEFDVFINTEELSFFKDVEVEEIFANQLESPKVIACSLIGISLHKNSLYQKNARIIIFGSAVFVIFAVLFPCLTILGDFLIFGDEYAITDFFSNPYEQYKAFETYQQVLNFLRSSRNAFVWPLISTWWLVWLIFGIFGAVLVVIPSIMKLTGHKPRKLPQVKIGVATGLIGIGIVFGLFLFVFLLENWQRASVIINIISLGSFIIGWVGLLVAYLYSRKN
ncbi:MAG: hypothetical protein ACXAC8_14560 [Candidatus Hodarchaeales archaeon]|jgi:hypothetical protein